MTDSEKHAVTSLPSGWQPNSRYDLAFAILRIDDLEAGCDPETAVTVQKVVWSQEEAEAEVSRLNRLNGDRNARYFYQVARVQRAPGRTRGAGSYKAAQHSKPS